jgi:hypothetical protein
MMAKKGFNTCDPNLLKHNYEMLRANALGTMNRASEFTVFLRHGMSAWMRLVGERDSGSREIPPQSSYAFTQGDADRPDAGLASILIDAILNTARPATHFRGNT